MNKIKEAVDYHTNEIKNELQLLFHIGNGLTALTPFRFMEQRKKQFERVKSLVVEKYENPVDKK